MGIMPQRNIFSSLRRQAREAVIQVLYQDDLNPGVSPEVGEILLAERLRLPELAKLERRQLADLAKLAVADFDEAASTQRFDEEMAQDIRRATVDFARQLIAGVRRNRSGLDAAIGQVAENWSLHRMAATDRSVLRLGAYELLHTSLPPRVAVDEAVELAKRFGTAQSGSFVNGILDRLMHSIAAAPQAEPVPKQQDQ